MNCWVIQKLKSFLRTHATRSVGHFFTQRSEEHQNGNTYVNK